MVRMAPSNLPGPFAEIDEMVERGDLDAARESLAAVTRPSSAPGLIELVEVKIQLREGSMLPQVAMNRLLALMRTDAKLPGAHELYKEASELSYGSGSSSLSHSHPPPPIKPK